MKTILLASLLLVSLPLSSVTMAEIPPVGQDALYLSSGPASASTNTPQYRANTMAGLFGVNVPADRNSVVPAWYQVGQSNWQWFDALTTVSHSWKGINPITAATMGEFGHRLVINVKGGYPVSAYTLTISSSLTNITPITFGVGTNTPGGGEIQFNPQFVGINFGGNNVYESSYNGRLIAGGDDTVFDAGQYPSVTAYTAFARFGSTLSIVATTQADIESLRRQFSSSNHWLRVELKKNGVVTVSKTISASSAQIAINQNSSGQMITVAAVGGQENSAYSILSSTNLMPSSWQAMPGGLVTSGGGFTFPKPVTQTMFFRLRSE